MAFRKNRDSRYFSLAGYRSILVRALTLGYRLLSFREFEPPAEQPVLLLRHDLDRPIRAALPFAELEAELGVRATYFVQTASDFYNLLSRENRQLLRGFVALGHEIGLHYEARRYVGSDGEQTLLSDLRLLHDLAGQTVCSASQHIPIDDIVVSLTKYVANEAYEPRFTEAPMTYISDSLMAWRQATPHDLLDRMASFQLLTHPDTWLGPSCDMGEVLTAMMNEDIEVLKARYREIAAYYERIFQDRTERDGQFRARRRLPPKPVGNG